MNLRRIIYVAAFLVVLALAIAIAAYNMYGAFGLTPIPPGRMSVLTYIGLKDLQRGALTSEALKAPALLAYALGRAGLGDFAAVEASAAMFFAAIPLSGGLFAWLATKSKLVGGTTAILLSLLPLTYLSAIGGDYSFVSVLALVQGAALFSLLFIKGRRAPLLALWLALASVIAWLAGLTVASASWVLFLTGAAWAAYSVVKMRRAGGALVILPGIFALGANLVFAPPGPEEALRLISPLSTLPQYVSLLALVGVAAAAGGAVIAYRLRWESVPVFAFVGSGLVLVPFYWAEALLLVFPGLVLLTMQPLVDPKRVARVLREAGPEGAESTVVELDTEKLAAVAFALLVLSSPLVVGFGPGSAVQGTNYLGNEELKALSEVQALNSSLFGQGLVAAPSSIAPWLRAEQGVNTLLALSPNDSALADAITSTSFRLRNS
ncbi:MAG: hypothetical protein JRN08_09330, partial [Nitrososphaerota archaeon]|nr:hypothetical protein [Nitrososphaerota archaeon]